MCISLLISNVRGTDREVYTPTGSVTANPLCFNINKQNNTINITDRKRTNSIVSEENTMELFEVKHFW